MRCRQAIRLDKPHDKITKKERTSMRKKLVIWANKRFDIQSLKFHEQYDSRIEDGRNIEYLAICISIEGDKKELACVS